MATAILGSLRSVQVFLKGRRWDLGPLTLLGKHGLCREPPHGGMELPLQD